MSELVERKNSKNAWMIFFASLGMGLISLTVLYLIDDYSLLYYGDATSHLISAKRFVDSTNPGLEQIGTVWLPLPHVIMLPFSTIESLFSSGMVGTIVNLPLHALTAVFVYKIIQNHTKRGWVAIVGGMLYASNPNLIYLGITAMTEAPFLLFFVGSAYFLQKWIQKLSDGVNVRYIAYSAIFISMATLCRYEAWVLAPALIGITIYFAKNKITQNKKTIFVILVSLISGTGILFWLGWNEYSYGDPLEFANAEFYAASSQAVERPYRDFLYLQPQNVLYIYGAAAFMISGPVLLSISVIGFYHYIKQKPRDMAFLPYFFLSLPVLFTLLTMFGGIAEMSQWWFNARFATFLTPLVIVFACVALFRLKENIHKKTGVSLLVASLFVFQIFSPTFSVVTFADAESGWIYKQSPYSKQVADYLQENYDDGKIMIMTGSAQAHRIMVSGGVPLVTYDEMIQVHLDRPSFTEPWNHDKWIIMGLEPDSDSMSAVNYWSDNMKQLNEHYSLVYENQFYKVFKLIS